MRTGPGLFYVFLRGGGPPGAGKGMKRGINRGKAEEGKIGKEKPAGGGENPYEPDTVKTHFSSVSSHDRVREMPSASSSAERRASRLCRLM